MKTPEKNRNVLRNFVLHLTHCSHPSDGDDPEFKTPQTYTPEIMYQAIDDYIAEDHVDGYDITDTTQYPYDEGDDYWVIEPYIEMEFEDSQGVYRNGIRAVQSCWDDQSEDFHRENPDREYFDSLDELLQYAKDRHEFVKVECFDCDEYLDVETGDYFVADEDTGKFRKVEE